jgi:hypothetical protein
MLKNLLHKNDKIIIIVKVSFVILITVFQPHRFFVAKSMFLDKWMAISKSSFKGCLQQST